MFVLQGSRAPRPYDEQYWFHRTGHGSQICGGEEGATESGMMVLERRTGGRNWGWAGGVRGPKSYFAKQISYFADRVLHWFLIKTGWGEGL